MQPHLNQVFVSLGLVVGLTPTFFVTEADVHCIGGTVTGRTMYLSVPLCRILTVEELSAVIAHELGHFRGEDTVCSAFDSIRSTEALSTH